MIEATKSRFDLGQVLATPGAIDALAESGQEVSQFLQRHQKGDWGVVGEDDAEANEQSLKDGSRLLSAFLLTTGQKIWIITEAVGDDGQRAATTVLLPDEY